MNEWMNGWMKLNDFYQMDFFHVKPANVWTCHWWSSAAWDTFHCAQTSSTLTGWVTHIGVSEGDSGNFQALISSCMTELSVNTGAASTSKSSLLLFQDLCATGVGLIWWAQSSQVQIFPPWRVRIPCPSTFPLQQAFVLLKGPLVLSCCLCFQFCGGEWTSDVSR